MTHKKGMQERVRAKFMYLIKDRVTPGDMWTQVSVSLTDIFSGLGSCHIQDNKEAEEGA